MIERSIIERALELADSGKHRTVSDIRITLHHEGYVMVTSHLAGRSIVDQLRARIAAAHKL